MKIVLHIDRVVLDGLAVSGTDGPRLSRALTRELTRLLSDGGVAQGLSGGTVVPRVQVPRLSTAAREKPDALGVKIARSVYAGIGKPR